MNWNPNRRSFNAMIAATAGVSALGLKPASAATIKVAGIYTQPIQQKWDARLHQGLEAAKAKGEIEYVFSEKVANTDYIRVLREYCESGVKLIVGEAFGISKEARKVADEYPDIAFLMGDPFKPHGSNFAVFDNYIHELDLAGEALSQELSKSRGVSLKALADHIERRHRVRVAIGAGSEPGGGRESADQGSLRRFDPGR